MHEQCTADAASRVGRIDEERADPGGVLRRIEQAGIAVRIGVAGTESAGKRGRYPLKRGRSLQRGRYPFAREETLLLTGKG
jgi:hypothetical protein